MARRSLAFDLVVGAVAFAVLALLPVVWPSKALVDFVIRGAALGLFATSLNVLVGYGGMVSFGHGMFFGLGAYSFALLMQRTGMPTPAAFGLTLILCAALGLIVGAICVRLKEIYFAFLTLAFQMLLHSLIKSALFQALIRAAALRGGAANFSFHRLRGLPATNKTLGWLDRKSVV